MIHRLEACATLIFVICLCHLPAALWSAEQQQDAAWLENWPQWRGPLASGVAPGGNPPVEWGEEQNIRWKTPLPGIGYSTPVIWGDTIFLTSSIELEAEKPAELGKSGNRPAPYKPVRFIVLAVDRKSGEILWERVACEEIPHEGMHPTTTWASASPITDGKHVFACFGSRGLYCYDMDGKLLWEKDFGRLRMFATQGEGATPALYQDRLIVTWDHEDQSFITVLDAATGREIWRKDREEDTSWSTPLVVEVDGRAQVITTGVRRVRAYDLASGDLVWEDAGFVETIVPSPVAVDGVVYLTGGYQQKDLRAVRLSDAKGDIGGSPAVLWKFDEAPTPFVPSLLVMDGLLYFLTTTKGDLTCMDAKTGKIHYANQRLEGIGTLYASPAAVGDRIYITGRKGVTVVFRHGPTYELLAANELDDNIDASPVIIGDEIYLRGHQYLYCIARPSES